MTVSRIGIVLVTGVLAITQVFHFSTNYTDLSFGGIRSIVNRRSIPLSPLKLPLSIPSLEDYSPTFEPLWSCQDDIVSIRKLIFVHVFKTAGSTFRTFFEKYGKQCRKGISVLIGCSGISSSYRTGDIWGGDKHDHCKVKSSWNRQNHTLTARRAKNVTSDFLSQHETDVLIGHIPIGVHTGWNEGQSPIQPTYMTFVREPVSKYVSSRLFVYQSHGWAKNITFEQAVDRIRSDINALEGKQYNVYTKYLLTPEQKELGLSQQEQAEMILKNLVELPTVVGVVERMEDSLALLKFLIDPTQKMTDTIDAINGVPSSNKTKTLVKNKSSLSTSKIVAELQKDTATYRRLLDCLQLEWPIYDFAIQLHERQVQWLHSLR